MPQKMMVLDLQTEAFSFGAHPFLASSKAFFFALPKHALCLFETNLEVKIRKGALAATLSTEAVVMTAAPSAHQ